MVQMWIAPFSRCADVICAHLRRLGIPQCISLQPETAAAAVVESTYFKVPGRYFWRLQVKSSQVSQVRTHVLSTRKRLKPDTDNISNEMEFKQFNSKSLKQVLNQKRINYIRTWIFSIFYTKVCNRLLLLLISSNIGDSYVVAIASRWRCLGPA